MSDIILHHYAFPTFSEKVRVVLSYKGLAYRSVDIPGLPFEVKGPDGVYQLHQALMPAFPDMQLPLHDFVAEGEKVLVRLTIHATHTGPFGDMAATGKRINVNVLDLFQFRDGVLVEHWAQLDNLGMMKQLGAIQ